jgi:hypothetical protein
MLARGCARFEIEMSALIKEYKNGTESSKQN